MGKFYIETSASSVANGGKVVYELSATTDISVRKGSKITSYPVETGRMLTDNIVVDEGTVSFSGIITDVSFSDVSNYSATDGSSLVGTGAELVEKYIEQIKTRMDNRETFTFYFSNVLKPLRNCVITSFDYSKTNKIGNESWEIKISAQPVKFARRAQFVREPAENWSALINGAKQGTGNKSTVSPEKQEELAFTKCMGEIKYSSQNSVGLCQLAPTEQYPAGEIVTYSVWQERRKAYFANKNKTVKKG